MHPALLEESLPWKSNLGWIIIKVKGYCNVVSNQNAVCGRHCRATATFFQTLKSNKYYFICFSTILATILYVPTEHKNKMNNNNKSIKNKILLKNTDY